MGETVDEVKSAMRDLRDAGCDILTVTQYLRPSNLHHPIERWVKPEEFVMYRDYGHDIGFAGVMAGPLVRSSYRAGRLYAQAIKARGEELPANLRHLGEGIDDTASQEASTLLSKYGASRETPVDAR